MTQKTAPLEASQRIGSPCAMSIRPRASSVVLSMPSLARIMVQAKMRSSSLIA